MLNAELFGIKEKEARENKRIKQNKLAERLGITAQALSNYETGKKLPPLNTAVDIARELEVSLDWLFGLPKYSTKTKPSTLADIVDLIEMLSDYFPLHISPVTTTYVKSDTFFDQPIDFNLNGTVFSSDKNWNSYDNGEYSIPLKSKAEVMIRFQNSELNSYLEKREKVLKLLHEGVIDRDFYNSWCAGEKAHLKETHVYTFFESLDVEGTDGFDKETDN